MTVGWNDVQNAIKKAVRDTGAVAASAVAWVDEQRPTAKRPVLIEPLYFDVIQNRETQTAHVPDDGGFDWSLSSLVYIRVQIKAESSDNGPGLDALFTLEKVRGGLLRPDLVLDAGVALQPDDQTYIHRLVFPWDGRIISCYGFEMGFRAIVDYPLADTVSAAPNMNSVDINTGEEEIGEDDPVVVAEEIFRP